MRLARRRSPLFATRERTMEDSWSAPIWIGCAI
jgi:hypothetical protein